MKKTTTRKGTKDAFGIDWTKCINWNRVDEILKNPEKEENKKIIEIINKMK